MLHSLGVGAQIFGWNISTAARPATVPDLSY